MRCFQVRLVSFYIKVDLKNPDSRGIFILKNGVEGEDARLGTNGGFDLLSNGGFVVLKVRGIDVEFRFLQV